MYGRKIVDAISLFYPPLHRVLERSNLLTSDQVALLVLSPVSSMTIQLSQLIEQRIHPEKPEESVMGGFPQFDPKDKLCEFDIGYPHAFERWLFTILPEVAAIRIDQAFEESKRAARKRMGETRGVQRLVFG